MIDSYAPPVVDVIEVLDGQRLLVGEWPADAPTLVFAPGLTSTHRNIAAVAKAAQGKLRIVAIDLRGRGCSTKPAAGNYGIERHAQDFLAVMDRMGIARAIFSGHSMGAYVATAAAVKAPHRAIGLALIDGGVILPGTPDENAVARLESALKPILDRLRRTFGSVAEYRNFWYSMPYVEECAAADQYLLYDLGVNNGRYQPKCSYDAALEDWRDLIANPVTFSRLEAVRCPVLAIGAETGLVPGEPSVLSDVHLRRLREAVDKFDFVRVPKTTHHSVTLSEAGAAATAKALVEFAARLT